MTQISGPKITMVGGGSYNWSPKLLSDLMQTPEMEGSEIVLLDINIEAAEEIRAVAETLASSLGKHYTVWATSDEASAFRDADFVVITISTGGLEMRRHDLIIPEKYGIYQTVGDTVGPGGWARALRNVPVFVHLGQQIERYAPRAIVLNYSNPLACLTGALAQVTDLHVVGLCHGVFEVYTLLENLFGVEEKDLSVRFGGVNHFFWVLDFSVKGQPGYPLLEEKLRGRTLDDALSETQVDGMGFVHAHHMLCHELYQAYGYLPYVGDRHTCEFVPGYLGPTPDVLDRFNLRRTSVDERYGIRDKTRQVALDIASGKRGPFKRSRETAVDIMMAMAKGKAFFDVVNVPNVGQIDNLPRGAVVETLGLIDDLGFRPIVTGSLPPTIEQLVAPHTRCQQMTLEAALTGDRELALRSLMTDPLCGHLSPSEVRSMGEDLMSATKDWLPQFK